MKLSTKPKSERRKHPRSAIGLPMNISAKGTTIGKCRATLIDISAGGLAFRSCTELEEGMSLYFKLDAPLEVRGEIVNRKIATTSGGMHRYGVRFHKIGCPPIDQAAPENLIAMKPQTPNT